MDNQAWKARWKAEEAVAHIHGWDFSHIEGRYDEERDLPWDYDAIVRSYVQPEKKLMDYDTGGGEYLLSLASAREHGGHRGVSPQRGAVPGATVAPGH